MKKNILVEKFVSLDRNTLRQITGGGSNKKVEICPIILCGLYRNGCDRRFCYCNEWDVCTNL